MFDQPQSKSETPENDFGQPMRHDTPPSFSASQDASPPARPSPFRPVPHEPQGSMDAARLRVMPEKFITPDTPGGIGGSASRAKIFVAAGLGLVVLAVLGAGVWYFVINTSNTSNPGVNGNSSVALATNTQGTAQDSFNAGAANATSNVNTTFILNGNANGNSNTPLVENENINTSVVPPPVNTSGVSLPSSEDTDSDGLTDSEELLYGTALANPDSDGDTFMDGEEVLNGYDPARANNAKLDTSTAVTTYADPGGAFSLRAPSAFSVRQGTVPSSGLVFFTADTGEFVQVSVQENPQTLSSREWYLASSSGVDSAKVLDVVVQGVPAAVSPDGMNVYFARGQKVYVLTYNAGERPTLNYKTTFKMMYGSFSLIGSTLTNTNSEG